jgi:hypothetical protein
MKYIIKTPNYSTIENIRKMGFTNLTLEIDIIYFKTVLDLTMNQLHAIIHPDKEEHYDLDLVIQNYEDLSIVFRA